MKLMMLLLLMFIGKLAFSQLDKSFFLYVDPISISTRNPSIGLELKLKNSFFNSIQFEGSYMFQDKKIGGFIYKGYENEKSTITKFESYPRNRIPFYVYDGYTYRIAGLKYFSTKSANQYYSISIVGKTRNYDSIEVNYNNTPKVKRESLFDQSGYYTHTRNQSEKMKAIGLGLEYGIRRAKDNIIYNFFVRTNCFFANRNIVTYNEQFNYYVNGDLTKSESDKIIHRNSYNTIQIRPEIGIRIGLTNF